MELANGDWAICYLNTGPERMTLRINWEHFTMMKGEYAIRDVWQHKDLGKTDQKSEFDLESHDVRLLRLTKLK